MVCHLILDLCVHKRQVKKMEKGFDCPLSEAGSIAAMANHSVNRANAIHLGVVLCDSSTLDIDAFILFF